MKSKWLVVGAGPCGIGAAGRLLDFGLDVILVDPKMSVGRMGEYYRDVPGNTPNSELRKGLEKCSKFNFKTTQLLRNPSLISLPPTECSNLGYLVDALSDSLNQIRPNIDLKIGTVTSLKSTKLNLWNAEILINNKLLIEANIEGVILATGAIPLQPMLSDRIKINRCGINIHPLDYSLSSQYITNILHSNPQLIHSNWVVVGNSHSAILVIKNLYENGIQNISNIYKSNKLKYQEIIDQNQSQYR